jgi:hypothetical protein
MNKQSWYRSLLLGGVVLTVGLLVAVLLLTTRSAGATLALTWSGDAPLAPARPSRAPADTYLLLPNSTAAYNGVITPSQLVYAPWLLGRTSVVRVYNAGAQEAAVRATFSYSAGLEITQQYSLPAGAVGDIWSPNSVLTGTEMSLILTGTQPLVAVVNDFGVDEDQMGSYAAIPAGLGQTYLVLPFISSRPHAWDGRPVVQNVGVTNTNVTIVYTDSTGVFHWDDSVPELAPGQAHIFDPVDVVGADGLIGIATIKSDEPVVAVVSNGPASRDVYVYSLSLPPAVGGANRPLYYPMLLNEFENSWTRSEVYFLNTGAVTATLDLEIDGQLVLAAEPVKSWKTKTVSQATFKPEVPDWNVGAGLVEDAQSLHSIAWLLGVFKTDPIAAYTASSRGATTWYFPYADASEYLSTYVAVQNLSDDSIANITCTFHDTSGALPPEPAVVAPPSGMTFCSTESDLHYGLVVQADQPVVAVAVIAGQLILDESLYMPVMIKKQK